MSKTNTSRSRAQIQRRRKIQRRAQIRVLRTALAKGPAETETAKRS